MYTIFTRETSQASCGSTQCGCHAKTRLFGPGTIVALIGAVVVVGVNLLTAPESVPRTSALPRPSRPLHKPEPRDLISGSLALTSDQRSKIAAIDDEWQRIKSGLATAMAGYEPRQARLDQIQSQMVSYSDLSRQYEAARAETWRKAMNVLDTKQRAKVTQ